MLSPTQADVYLPYPSLIYNTLSRRVQTHQVGKTREAGPLSLRPSAAYLEMQIDDLYAWPRQSKLTPA